MNRLLPIVLLSAIAILAVNPSPSHARSSRVASYSVDRAWPTAVRFLRIDLGCKIVERDPEAGYVIFELKKDDITYRGSLELVKTVDYADRDSTKLILEINKQPDYEEVWVLEKMMERMREDLGQPVDKEEPPKKEAEPKPTPDDKQGEDKKN